MMYRGHLRLLVHALQLLDFAIRYFHVLFSGEDGEGQGVAAKVNTPEPSGVQVWLERDGQLGAAKEGSASAEGSSSQARVRPPTGFDELLKLVGGLDFPLTEMAAAQAAADAAKAEAGTSGSGEEGPKPGLTSTMYKKGPFQPFFSLVSGGLAMWEPCSVMWAVATWEATEAMTRAQRQEPSAFFLPCRHPTGRAPGHWCTPVPVGRDPSTHAPSWHAEHAA